MKVLDLCTGIAGMTLGLQRAGMKTAAFCEIDKKAKLVLKKNYPGIPIYDDIRELTGKQIAEDIGAIDLICAGIPCQPYSIGGFRRGAEDDRCLWPETFRIIQEVRPCWFIGENVAGIINLGLDAIISDLESFAFSVQTFDITDDAYGLPTLERHIWIIAASQEVGCQRSQKRAHPNQRKEEQLPRNDPREYERWHLPKSRICGMGQRIPGKMDRLEQLGNAHDPIMPEIFGRAIMEIENNQQGE